MLLALILAQALAAAPQPVASLVDKARLARYQQDSTLAEYRTVVKQRASSGIGLSQVFGAGLPGRERLAARFETVARVGWNHRTGAWGEVVGARTVVPLVGINEPDDAEEVALVLPYHPGRDELWPISELREAIPNHEDWIRHPLETGSDSLYAFTLGDSVRIRLPGGDYVRLREIIVRPRRPSEKLIVGSLWVDVVTGSLVRAAYRPSTSIDLWPLLQREISPEDRDVVKKFGPFLGTVREVVIEHGLYEGRFWLPRVRTANAEGTAKGGLISFTIEQSFSYESVRGMPPGEVTRPERPAVDIDPRDGRIRRGQWSGERMSGSECRPSGSSPTGLWSPDSLAEGQTRVVYSDGIRFRVLSPCDKRTMISSPALPGSIYGDGEELFTETDFAKLRSDARRALAMGRQAQWSPQPIVLHYGIERGLLRYNRVEGLSAGLMAERELGDGYTAAALVRIGVAQPVPDAEASLWRTNMRGRIAGTAYRRLAVANDWGNPFSPGASAVAAVFGRDEGFYYRTYGAEITGSHQGTADGPSHAWRLFAEHQGDAPVETHRSIANLVNSSRFPANIEATTADFAGASWAGSLAAGSDPRGLRFSSMLRSEGAVRSDGAGFGRALVEMRVAKGLGSGVESSLSAAAGSSLGSVPVQRLFYVGGAHTIRGYAAGAMVGEASWFGRAEIGKGHPLIRPSLFADAGWAGPRADFGRRSTLLRGYGVGLSVLEGLVRVDVARSAQGTFRADFYFDPR